MKSEVIRFQQKKKSDSSLIIPLDGCVPLSDRLTSHTKQQLLHKWKRYNLTPQPHGASIVMLHYDWSLHLPRETQ